MPARKGNVAVQEFKSEEVPKRRKSARGRKCATKEDDSEDPIASNPTKDAKKGAKAQKGSKDVANGRVRLEGTKQISGASTGKIIPVLRALMVLPLGGLSFLAMIWTFRRTSPIEGLEIPLPTNLADAQELFSLLPRLSEEHPYYVIEVFVLTYLFKQAFNIPGSTLLNVLAGGLFGKFHGTILCSLCAATGATLNFLISSYFFKDLVKLYFHSHLKKVESMVRKHQQHGLFYYLMSLRVLPMMPNFLMNAIFPIVGVPIKHFFFSVLFGLLPFQFACVKSGLLIKRLNSTSDVLDMGTIIDITVISFVFLAIAFFKRPSASPTESSAE